LSPALTPQPSPSPIQAAVRAIQPETRHCLFVPERKMTAKMGDGKISSARRDPSRTRVNASAISPISCHPDGPGSRGRADDGHRRRHRHGLAAKPAGRTSSVSGSEPWLTIASLQTATGRTHFVGSSGALWHGAPDTDIHSLRELSPRALRRPPYRFAAEDNEGAEG
jgi:hypothetical protein